jgi:hypothetical protein
MRRLALRALFGCAFGVALWPSALRAEPVDLEVRLGDCRSGVTLIARNAPLDAVLQELARRLQFKLHDKVQSSRVVNVTVSAPAPRLIAGLLSADEGFMVAHANDPRCPGQKRIAQLWLLPKGAKATANAQPTNAKRLPVTETATPAQLRLYEEDARKRKAAYDGYVREHGVAPPGEEEEAARP